MPKKARLVFYPRRESIKSMKELTMNILGTKPSAYPILIANHLLAEPERWLTKKEFHHLVIITDDHVKAHFGSHLLQNVRRAGFDNSFIFSFLPGEQSKRLSTHEYLVDQMLKQHCDRNTLILALGGGVVGDVAGFLAATYMRGISYIQIPTTLLAMVDSSVGGKTGVDTVDGKNLIGSFWQPAAVIADLNCLKTLSREQFINGLIEAAKMFLTHDTGSFFHTLENLDSFFQLEPSALQQLISQALAIKMAVVSRDEKEKGERMALNFGHTIGHALEKQSGYSLLHGFAVALGILVEAKIAELQGLLAPADYQLIKAFFLKLNISGRRLRNFASNDILSSTRNDKKSHKGHSRYVLLETIGKVYQHEGSFAHIVQDDIVKIAFEKVSEDL